jgi:hypothetical protein
MDIQGISRPIFAPVILGTSRQGRASEQPAIWWPLLSTPRLNHAQELIPIFTHQLRFRRRVLKRLYRPLSNLRRHEAFLTLQKRLGCLYKDDYLGLQPLKHSLQPQ